MTENQSPKKEKKNPKGSRTAIAEKLADTFAAYKNKENEKKFNRSIKKASKILNETISFEMNGNGKPAKEPKASAPAKKSTKKATPSKKAAAKKSKA